MCYYQTYTFLPVAFVARVSYFVWSYVSRRVFQGDFVLRFLLTRLTRSSSFTNRLGRFAAFHFSRVVYTFFVIIKFSAFLKFDFVKCFTETLPGFFLIVINKLNRFRTFPFWACVIIFFVSLIASAFLQVDDVFCFVIALSVAFSIVTIKSCNCDTGFTFLFHSKRLYKKSLPSIFRKTTCGA